MVCLFEQSEADYQLKKRISKKLYIDLHFNETNKYLTPSQNMT